MKSLFVLSVLLVGFSCTTKQESKSSLDSLKLADSLKAGVGNFVSFTEGKFEYVIEVDTLEGGNCTVKSIKILEKANHQLIQTINPEENSFFCGLKPEEIITSEDINFDGINDIRIVQFIPSSANVPYFYWTFDKNTSQFVEDNSLLEITSPVFDPIKKTITSNWNSGCCIHGTNVYQYVDGKLILIDSSETSDSPGESDTTATGD